MTPRGQVTGQRKTPSDNELRCLLHCAQYAVEQLTGHALYRDSVLPVPGSVTISTAIRAIEALKKDLR